MNECNEISGEDATNQNMEGTWGNPKPNLPFL